MIMNFETDNPEKGQLLQRSAHQRELIEEDVKLITEQSQKIITNALIIGGALAMTYLIVRSFSGSSGKVKTKAKKIKLVGSRPEAVAEQQVQASAEPGIMSQVGAVLAAQATGFLLSVAKEKLMEFLQSQTAKKGITHEHP